LLIDSLFLFGTLKDKDLFEIVLGTNIHFSPAIAPGFNVLKVQNAVYPIMVKDDKGEADGLLLKNLTHETIARADFYEQLFDYYLEPIQVTSFNQIESTFVYMPQNSVEPIQESWDLTEWQTVSAKVTYKFAKKVMSQYGFKSIEQVKSELNIYLM
tara:strand:+ start:2899 stop:3366 length:468 start_codon:yes stop_codon:yes gene_type:complete